MKHSWLAAVFVILAVGGCAANAHDHCGALDDALRTAFANVTKSTSLEVAVD